MAVDAWQEVGSIDLIHYSRQSHHRQHSLVFDQLFVMWNSIEVSSRLQHLQRLDDCKSLPVVGNNCFHYYQQRLPI